MGLSHSHPTLSNQIFLEVPNSRMQLGFNLWGWVHGAKPEVHPGILSGTLDAVWAGAGWGPGRCLAFCLCYDSFFLHST